MKIDHHDVKVINYFIKKIYNNLYKFRSKTAILKLNICCSVAKGTLCRKTKIKFEITCY